MFCHTAGKRDLAGQLGGTVPRQEVVHPVDGMLGDALQHVAQPSFGGDAIELKAGRLHVELSVLSRKFYF